MGKNKDARLVERAYSDLLKKELSNADMVLNEE